MTPQLLWERRPWIYKPEFQLVGGHITRLTPSENADDKAVVFNSPKGLQQLMNKLNTVTREFGMEINVKKDEYDVYCTKDIRSRMENKYLWGR